MDSQIGEVVYGSTLGDDSHVMSERVQSLAASVYQEFERMIKKYDEDVVKELMPLVVGILEAMDTAFTEKGENDVELELLRDDNEQLLTQYEREKQLRKVSEQKLLEIEDRIEEESRDCQVKLENVESMVRMLELKARNGQDHVSRLEEKESEMKKEYAKLHQRYTELFRTHMDHMERTKMFMGPDKMLEIGASPRSRSGFQMPVLRAVNSNPIYQDATTPDKSGTSPPSFPQVTSPRAHDPHASLRQELKGEVDDRLSSKETKEMMNKSIDGHLETAEKEQNTDRVIVSSMSTGMNIGDRAADLSAFSTSVNISDDSQIKQILTVTTGSKNDIDTRKSNKELSTSGTLIQTLSSSVSDLESTKAAYSMGIRVDPEDLDESHEQNSADEPLQSPEADDACVGKSSPLSIIKKTNESSLFDELSLEDAHALDDIDDGCDITGMSKEVENLILENTELLATKNALNVVKDDLIAKVDELSSEQEILREEITSLQTSKDKLRKRVAELDEDVKRLRDELDQERNKKTAENEEDQEEVPMAQRKRFTRVEMARVLMERNQYKERLMELQEAVRWTEMIRASREHPDLAPRDKKKGSIWNFFSNLFNPSGSNIKTSSKRPALPGASVKYSAPTSKVTPSGDPSKKQRDTLNLGDKTKAFEFLQDDLLAEKARKERERERREQYKQVRAHVKKDDGRMQAYGWSLPAKFTAPAAKESSNKSQVPVPVPVYCRPLLDKDDGMKLWCAAGINLTGGKTKDGGSIVGASVFYNSPPKEDKSKSTGDDVERLNLELQEHKKSLEDLENENLSSLVWICTTLHNSSHVIVVEANNPGDVLEMFHVTSSHILCIASVPGATETDYPSASDPIHSGSDTSKESSDKAPQPSSADVDDQSNIGGIRFVQCVAGAASGLDGTEHAPSDENGEEAAAAAATSGEDCIIDPQSEVRISRATGSPASSGDSTPSHSTPDHRTRTANTELIKDGLSTGPAAHSELLVMEVEKMSSVLPTMWLGCQSGSLYVHSAVSQWKRCLHSVKLKDSVLNIVHLKGRVFVALADGTLAVFHRDTDGQWDLKNYHVIDLGQPQHSIRCVCVVGNKHIWCGYRNKVHVINPKTLKLNKTFDAHPRKESQVRQLSWIGDGVWISIRLDSTLRLYHAYTHQHLQDVDIEPYVSKMLGTGKLGFSFVRITSLMASCNRLWIGTGNGVIISVPLSENNKQSVTASAVGRPGGVIRVYSDVNTDSVTPGSFLPYCSMAQAQLSFHGHRDAIKFFVAVPGTPCKGVSGVLATPGSPTESSPKTPEKDADGKSSPKKTMLVLSGGEGYIDFRIGETEEEGGQTQDDTDKKDGLSKGEKSHLIVWHLSGRW